MDSVDLPLSSLHEPALAPGGYHQCSTESVERAFPPLDPWLELARHASRGDRRATELLVRGLAPRVHDVARAILGSRHPDVDDLAQESLVSVVRALRSFEGRSTVLHYATRITVRVCIAGRKRARRAQHEDAELLALAADTTNQRPFRQLLKERRRVLVRALLAELPDAQSETLALRICLGLPMEEVAEMTGAPVNTVYSRLRLAKAALRTRIETDPVLKDMLEVGG
ncbi:MAG: RNA polymerase sigma factor [Sandaracinus sp.]